MTAIPFFDNLRQYQEIGGEIREAVARVLASGRLILGAEVAAFEEEFAAFLGGGHCVGVNSGTDALVVALMALGVGRGDEVVTVANTAVPTVSAIRVTGARPVFCDVDATALMDLEKVAACLGPATRAVVAVHLYGNVVDIPRLRSLLGSREVFIIEDCAQAHGATLAGKMAGTMGDAAAFSFYPTKNLGACGDAGLCVSADSALADRMRAIRMYGFSGEYYATMEGINSRLDEMQAAILRVKLRRLQGWIVRRREIAALYDRLLDRSVGRLVTADGVHPACHLKVLRVKRREELRRELAREGVATGIHYPWPIHLMQAYSFLGYRPGSLPVTEGLAQEVLSVPLFPELGDLEVEKVAAVINRAVRNQAKGENAA